MPSAMVDGAATIGSMRLSAAETELLQRLLVQRVGDGKPKDSVSGRQRKNGPSTGQRGVYEPQSLGLGDQRPLGEGEPELCR